MKFRKKPVVIDAIQCWSGLTCEELYETFGIPYTLGEEPKPAPFRFPGGCIEIDTLEGTMRATAGDWIIRGVKGEFYPCKPDIFAATYEAA